MDAKGLVRKRAPFTGHCRAADKGKVCSYRLPSTRRACGRHVFGSLIQVLTPLQHVAVHIVEIPGVGHCRPDLVRLTAGIRPVPHVVAGGGVPEARQIGD